MVKYFLKKDWYLLEDVIAPKEPKYKTKELSLYEKM